MNVTRRLKFALSRMGKIHAGFNTPSGPLRCFVRVDRFGRVNQALPSDRAEDLNCDGHCGPAM
jgi:hypothetical protein